MTDRKSAFTVNVSPPCNEGQGVTIDDFVAWVFSRFADYFRNNWLLATGGGEGLAHNLPFMGCEGCEVPMCG